MHTEAKRLWLFRLRLLVTKDLGLCLQEPATAILCLHALPNSLPANQAQYASYVNRQDLQSAELPTHHRVVGHCRGLLGFFCDSCPKHFLGRLPPTSHPLRAVLQMRSVGHFKQTSNMLTSSSCTLQVPQTSSDGGGGQGSSGGGECMMSLSMS